MFRPLCEFSLSGGVMGETQISVMTEGARLSQYDQGAARRLRFFTALPSMKVETFSH
jgi:hypothetical protein